MAINFNELHKTLSAPLRYLLAFTIFSIALALRFLILPVSSGFAFLTFYPAVVLAFYICGSKSGYLLIALSAFCGYYIFSPPFWTMSSDLETIVAIGFYIASSFLMGFIVKKGQYWYDQAAKKERDASDQKINTIDTKLNRINDLLEMAEKYANAGAWRWNIVTNQYCWSNHLFELFGLNPEVNKANRSAWQKTLHPEDLNAVEEKMNYSIAHHKPFATTYRIVLPSGETRWIDAYGSPIYDAFDNPIEFVGFCINSTALHQAQEEVVKLNAGLELQVAIRTADLLLENKNLAHLSRHDVLTGLSNRLAANERLRIEFLSMKRSLSPYAVLMVDIDFFKTVNDTYGHAFGDEVLREVANALKETIRETDFLARYGGEEFMILLPHTDLAEAWIVADKMRRNVESLLHAVAGKVTASIGIAMARPNQKNENIAMEKSDSSLYVAKKSGRNCVILSDEN